MEVITRINALGFDTVNVLKRLGGNSKLYLDLCIKFLDDKTFSNMQQAISLNQRKNIDLSLHTMKGLAANLGFIQMEILVNDCLYSFRQMDFTHLNSNLFFLSNEYERITDIIRGVIFPFVTEQN